MGKILRKNYSVLVVFAAMAWGPQAMSQQEAITSWTLGIPNIVGYATNGAGFAFLPTVNLAVTALGFGGSDIGNYPYQVTLYSSSGISLVTAQVSTNSTFLNQTYYQSISPLMLTAGTTYFIGAVEVSTNGNFWVGDVSVNGSSGNFTANPFISYENSAVNFAPPSNLPTLMTNSGYFVGANFEFTVVPEPPAFGLGAFGVAFLFLSRRLKPFIRT